MFSGESEHTLDDKGRLFVPIKYREAMGEMVVLWRGMDGQINVHPQERWQQVAEQIRAQNQAHRAARDMSRIVFSANECEVDRQGRILIPPPLRKYAALGTEVVILGIGDHLEIWSQERWNQLNERYLTAGGEISEVLAQAGLVL